MTPDAAAPRIIAIIVTANDEARVGAALESLSWTDERIAIDLGSSDTTVQVCDAHGVPSFEPAALATEVVRRRPDWILLMEGHEQVPPALVAEMRDATSDHGATPGRADAYRVDRRVRFMGRDLRSRVWDLRGRVTLARRECVHWPTIGIPVESLPVEGEIARMQTPMLAEPYRSLQHYVTRMDLLTNHSAEALGPSTGAPRWGELAVRPLAAGLRRLPTVFRGAGMPGLIFACLEAYRLAVATAKRWERANARVA
jgi:(heptosyl)LPS beta-1,4-glucosyltransferase